MKQDALLVAPICALQALFAVSLAACGPVGDEDTAVAASAVLNANSLSPAALDPSSGAVAPALLAATALDPAELSPAALAALQDPSATGDLSRRLLSYTVGCAFAPTQSFTLSWVDASSAAQQQTYAGLIGLAPTWADAPLDATSEPWVSACLISRLNYFGIEVALSSRGSAPALAAAPGEIAAYPNQEGAFWGNVFTSPPTEYACDDTPDDAHSRSLDRVCAAGYVDAQGVTVGCGIVERVGSCDAACAPLTGANGLYHPSCTAPSAAGSAPGGGGLTSQVITVFLE
jgi:hypothetical protein